MLKSSELIKMFERMRDENWAYVWGSAKEREVDCSGAFVWAFKQANQTIPHGSNSIAHKNIVELLPISQAKPGMAVFRCKPWGDSDDDKKNHYYLVEPGNFYHIGLIGRDGKTVLHASGTRVGFIESELNSTWAFVGRLKRVEYDENNQNGSDSGMIEYPIYGQISITSGYVNLRSKPNVTSKVLSHMINHECVSIIGEESDGKWLHVEYKDIEGYAYAKYIKKNTTKIDKTDASASAVIPVVSSQKVIIVDSVGNRFTPVGDFTVLFDSVD